MVTMKHCKEWDYNGMFTIYQLVQDFFHPQWPTVFQPAKFPENYRFGSCSTPEDQGIGPAQGSYGNCGLAYDLEIMPSAKPSLIKYIHTYYENKYI